MTSDSIRTLGSFCAFEIVDREVRRPAIAARVLVAREETNVAGSPCLSLSIKGVRPESRRGILCSFSSSLIADGVRRLRRRIYAQRITRATTATAPKDAPIAAAMTSFFEPLPVDTADPSSDGCGDEGSALEEAAAGKILAAAVIAEGKSKSGHAEYMKKRTHRARANLLLDALMTVVVSDVRLDIVLDSVGCDVDDVLLVTDDS